MGLSVNSNDGCRVDIEPDVMQSSEYKIRRDQPIVTLVVHLSICAQVVHSVERVREMLTIARWSR